MEKEAEKINSWGENVYIKIPITNSMGQSSIPLIKKLSSKGMQLNITAILTLDQVEETVQAFKSGTKNIVSVFAGRIADSGIDPIPTMKEAAKICSKKKEQSYYSQFERAIKHHASRRMWLFHHHLLSRHP